MRCVVMFITAGCLIFLLPNPLLLPPYWPLLLADFRQEPITCFRSVLFPLPHLLVLSNILFANGHARMIQESDVCYTTSMYVTQSWCIPDEVDLCYFRICIITHNNNLFNKTSMYSRLKFCPQKTPIVKGRKIKSGYKQLLDEVFVISRIIKVEVSGFGW